MSSAINTYYEYAKLAMAAYVNFDVFTPTAVRNALRDRSNGDFRPNLANDFVGFDSNDNPVAGQGYTVLSQSPANINGFSATLFLDNATGKKVLAIRGTTPSDPGDLIDDALILSFGLSNQYSSLKSYYQQLVTEGKLSASETFSVTGHSLGGFLAQGFAQDYSNVVTQAYTYNALGYGGAPSELLAALGVTAANASGINITNLIAQAGLSFAAGYGTLLGTIQPIHIEEQDSAISNHYIKYLTDSLAMYDLFATIAPAVSVTAVTDVLKAASYTTLSRDGSDTSLENTLDALRSLFEKNYALGTPGTNATPTTPDNRDSFYTNLLSLQDTLKSLPWYDPDPNVQALNGFTVSNLNGRSTADLLTLAQNDMAYRYALYKLNPFTVSGAGLYEAINADHSLDRYDASTGGGALTDEYLRDRAAFLYNKMQANTHDSVFSEEVKAPYVSGGSLRVFEDKASNYQLYSGDPYAVATTPLDNFNQVRFGSSQGDTITGGDKWDKLYGMVGDDILQGNKGNDYLEGGQGTDTYLYTSGDGLDTILDTDGLGKIRFDGTILNGGDKLFGETYKSSDGKYLYTLLQNTTGQDLLISGMGGQTIVKDFQKNNLLREAA